MDRKTWIHRSAWLLPIIFLPLAAVPTSTASAVDPPTLQVAPDDEWVQQYQSWPPNASISMTIDDDADPTNGTLYTDAQTADGSGNFFFGLHGVFDVQRGHFVTIDDGTTTNVHQVTDLFVDGVNAVTDTVYGRAVPGSDVDVFVWNVGVGLTVTADGSGDWVADDVDPEAANADNFIRDCPEIDCEVLA